MRLPQARRSWPASQSLLLAIAAAVYMYRASSCHWPYTCSVCLLCLCNPCARVLRLPYAAAQMLVGK